MTANKLWQIQTSLHPLVETYTVGQDNLADQKLLPYDIKASKAHADMLHKTGVLAADENHQLQTGLDEILQKWKKGQFIITADQEDSHTAIENYLTLRLGATGKKIHTGRSRNDQAMVMVRLYLKENLTAIDKQTANLAKTLAAQAQKHSQTVMPGYTHGQKAMPTTVRTWLDSFAQGFKDSRIQINSALKLIDQNPLGSASGFGINTKLVDRQFTTKQLDFAKTQTNPQYCGLSRGMFEGAVLQSLALPMQLCGRFAADMMLFTMPEFRYFSLPDSFTTGSSIMPQKRNYDLFEIMRANVRTFLSKTNETQQITTGLISGYNRDTQATKQLLIENLELFNSTIQLLDLAAQNLAVHQDNLKSAMTDELYATDKVYHLVEQGTPFRDAYVKVKRELTF